MDATQFRYTYGVHVWAVCVQIYNAITEGKKHILLKAPVKSGKKIITQGTTFHLKDTYQHYYCVSLNRKDVRKQQVDLEAYGVKMALTFNNTLTNESIEAIRACLRSGKSAVLHVDECDYGSGKKQQLSKLYNHFKDNENVIIILYSATPEEVTLSETIKGETFEEINYYPPPHYRGAAWFLSNGLVHEAKDFVDWDKMDITDHGKQVLSCMSRERNVGVVRITKKPKGKKFKDLKDDDVFKNKVRYYCRSIQHPTADLSITWLDQNSEFDWEREDTWKFKINNDHFHIYVIDMTCCRGTDLKYAHPRLAFWHDCRPAKKSSYNTLAQAFLRPAHFHETGHHIHIYADVNVFKLAANKITPQEYSKYGKISTRTTRTYTKTDHCNRTVGTIDEVNHLLSIHSLPSVHIRDFQRDGPYFKAFLRNEFAIRSYDFVMRQKNWGISSTETHHRRRVYPCYCDPNDQSTLVWVVVWNDGTRHETIDVATNKHSMYSPAIVAS